MFNSIKFELLKRKKILGIIVILAVITQIFSISKFIGGEKDSSLASIALFMFISFLIFIFSSISTFSKDINSTDRSISFMVPKSGFNIVGTKFLAVLISGFILGIVELIWFGINVFFMATNFNFHNFSESGSLAYSIQIGLLSFASFASFLALVLLSIIITKTFLSKVKFKFVIVIIIMAILSKVFNLVFWNNLGELTSSNLSIDIVAITIFTVFMLWLSGWFIDNKTDF